MEKESRASDTAKLFVTGRDTPYQEFTLRFRDCSWELVERQTQEQLAAAEIPPVLFRVVEFMQDKEEWSGDGYGAFSRYGRKRGIVHGHHEVA